VNILCVQETKWKRQKVKEVEETGFKLWYIGNTSTKNGVGIVLDKSLKDGVVDIKRQRDMIILVKLFVGDLVFNVISAYASQIGLNESVKMQFWEELDALVSSVSISEKLFIGGDLNGHLGSTRVSFDRVAKGPSTWWLESAGGTPQVGGSTPGLGLKKSHSPIPLKAHGKGPAVGRLGCGALCMGG
jgi:hypothetical protein